MTVHSSPREESPMTESSDAMLEQQQFNFENDDALLAYMLLLDESGM